MSWYGLKYSITYFTIEQFILHFNKSEARDNYCSLDARHWPDNSARTINHSKSLPFFCPRVNETLTLGCYVVSERDLGLIIYYLLVLHEFLKLCHSAHEILRAHCIGIDMFLNTIYAEQKYLVQMKFESSAATFSIEITQLPRGFRKDFNPLD